MSDILWKGLAFALGASAPALSQANAAENEVQEGGRCAPATEPSFGCLMAGDESAHGLSDCLGIACSIGFEISGAGVLPISAFAWPPNTHFERGGDTLGQRAGQEHNSVAHSRGAKP